MGRCASGWPLAQMSVWTCADFRFRGWNVPDCMHLQFVLSASETLQRQACWEALRTCAGGWSHQSRLEYLGVVHVQSGTFSLLSHQAAGRPRKRPVPKSVIPCIPGCISAGGPMLLHQFRLYYQSLCVRICPRLIRFKSP
jgi:hypothetical protein